MSRLAHILIWLYQRLISPVFLAVGVKCRHYPSCSAYTDEAIRRHGFWPGGWMGLARLLRCHPWGTQGLDDVPPVADGAWYAPWRYGHWRSTFERTSSDGHHTEASLKKP